MVSWGRTYRRFPDRIDGQRKEASSCSVWMKVRGCVSSSCDTWTLSLCRGSASSTLEGPERAGQGVMVDPGVLAGPLSSIRGYSQFLKGASKTPLDEFRRNQERKLAVLRPAGFRPPFLLPGPPLASPPGPASRLLLAGGCFLPIPAPVLQPLDRARCCLPGWTGVGPISHRLFFAP